MCTKNEYLYVYLKQVTSTSTNNVTPITDQNVNKHLSKVVRSNESIHTRTLLGNWTNIGEWPRELLNLFRNWVRINFFPPIYLGPRDRDKSTRFWSLSTWCETSLESLTSSFHHGFPTCPSPNSCRWGMGVQLVSSRWEQIWQEKKGRPS